MSALFDFLSTGTPNPWASILVMPIGLFICFTPLVLAWVACGKEKPSDD